MQLRKFITAQRHTDKNIGLNDGHDDVLPALCSNMLQPMATEFSILNMMCCLIFSEVMFCVMLSDNWRHS